MKKRIAGKKVKVDRLTVVKDPRKKSRAPIATSLGMTWRYAS